VHPRFSGEKLKRRARWQEFPWIASRTKLPIIGNGMFVLCGISNTAGIISATRGSHAGSHRCTEALDLPRICGHAPLEINHAEVWERLYHYTLEDLPLSAPLAD